MVVMVICIVSHDGSMPMRGCCQTSKVQCSQPGWLAFQAGTADDRANFNLAGKCVWRLQCWGLVLIRLVT